MLGWWNYPDPAPLPRDGLEVFLRARPDGVVDPDRDFGTRRVVIPSPDTLVRDTVLARVLFVSCDPAMRGWMTTAPSYIEPVALGAPMRAPGIGEVIASSSRLFRPGDLVSGMVGWREYAIMDSKSLEKVHIPRDVPLSAALGVLGGTGLTAYFGLLEIGKPKKGDVVVVSAAAGATGSIAAQIAKHVIGCYTVGIAGGSEKCKYLTNELGLDAAVDYKASPGVHAGLKAALAGRGVDVYFDNVGGETLEAVLRRVSVGARIVLCGAIADYNADARQVSGPGGIRNTAALISKRVSIRGFIVFDYRAQYAAARRELARWVRAGQIKGRETRVHGLDQAPHALRGLFRGENIGKVVVEVAAEPPSRGQRASKL